MAAQYTREYLAALRRGVERFEEAFDSWMDTQSETDRMFMPGLVERVFTKEGADPEEVRRRELAVAEAAGLAAKAVQVTGSYMVVQGLPGPVDPISNWRNMTMPKAFLTPGEVRATCASIKGPPGRTGTRRPGWRGTGDAGVRPLRATQGDLDGRRAALDEPSAPGRGAGGRGGAQPALEGDIAAHRRGRHGVLGADPGDGAARRGSSSAEVAGADSDKTTKSMREGLIGLAKGLNLAVRNVATHTRKELTEQEGMEQLGAYSHLARLLDKCTVERHAGDLAEDG